VGESPDLEIVNLAPPSVEPQLMREEPEVAVQVEGRDSRAVKSVLKESDVKPVSDGQDAEIC